MCWGPHISWCMLPGWWWSSVWEISRVKVNWDCWSSYRATLLLSFFQLFPNSNTGVSSFCPLVGYKYLHLTLSAACWIFQRAVMIGPFLWAHHSLSTSVRPWGLPFSWIPIWTCHCISFSSGSSPFFVPAVLSDRNNYGSGLWLWHGNPIPHLMPWLSAEDGLYMFPFLTVGQVI